jgi:nucleoside-diphosphate-sugar epimerase
MDMQTDRIEDLMGERRFRFFEGDITINREWIEYHVRKCDTVLPLVAIATPATYVREPLKVFELDFEANLPIIRSCVKYGKRVLFPSTSEVYGMCADAEFDPEASPLVLGPINKPRWIYSCAKQLMDRVIHAYGMDMQTDRIVDLLPEKRFHFFEGDITINKEWIEYHVKKADVVLPLVAIATPATYVREPLRVFELDFEANLPIVRAAVRHRKRLVFPSTSEVYGMCRDAEFDPERSELVLGPINKPRWIYACAKQLMDRVIHAYGEQEGLDYTLFRPFNWIGAGLDSINTAKEGSSRVITQFLGHIVRGEPIRLVDGGTQRRAFTYIDDGIAALMRIIENPGGVATRRIYNIGNPANDFSVRELAEKMVALALKYPEYRESAKAVTIVETTAADYYGAGYQDVQNRVPRIANTRADLGWAPQVGMDEALTRIFDAYRGHVADARALVD